MSTLSIDRSAARATPSRTDWLHRTLEQILAWQERARQRHQLRALGEVMLKDLGLSRADVAAELAKPFWRP